MSKYENLKESDVSLVDLIDEVSISFTRVPDFWQSIGMLLLLPLHYKHNNFIESMRGSSKIVSQLNDEDFKSFKEILEAYDEIGDLLTEGRLNVLIDRAVSLELTWHHLSLLDSFLPEDTIVAEFWKVVAEGKESDDIAVTIVGFLQSRA